MLRIISAIENTPPSILRGYVSSIYVTALEIMRRRVKSQVKAVTTTAEKLFSYQRHAIERAFGQKMYDQYGCGESNSIAFECDEHNGLHVASEHVIVELVDDHGCRVRSGSPGKVIITDLDNYAMPFIRYDNGDVASRNEQLCRCGRGSPLLERIDGRAYEMLEGPGGRKIHGGFFDEVYIEMKFGDKYEIDDLRVVQEDLQHYRLEFVMKEPLSDDDIRLLRKKYQEYLGDVNIRIEYVQSIPVSRTGKRMFVIPCHVPEKNGNVSVVG